MSLGQDRVEQYKKDIINAYAKSNDVARILKPERVQNTDGQFRKIGLRTLIDRRVFDNPSSILVFSDFGSSIARGETKYLLDQALQLSKMHREVDRANLTPRLLSEAMSSLFSDSFVLLVPNSMYYGMFLGESEWQPHYDSKLGAFTIQIEEHRVRILSVHEDFIDNNVIGLNANFGQWKSIIGDENSGVSVTIQVATQNESKVDLTVLSLVKFEPQDLMSISVVHMK